MLKYMLDTDTVSFALRGLGNAATRLLEHPPSEVCISSITLACISHHMTAGACDTTARTSLRLLAVLNVLSSTPARAKRRAPRPDGPLTHSASPRGEKYRLGELRFGAEARRSRKLHRLIDTFVVSVTVIPFDQSAADRFGLVAHALARRGEPIGSFDTLMAAHALSRELTFVTNNSKHFQRVRGLKTENWV